MTTHSPPGFRVGIFGKGGAGKSTVTVFLARALRSLGHTVVVLDADSTNVGLAAALGAAGDPEPLLTHFGGMVFSGGAVTCPVDDPTPLPGAEFDLADLPPRFVVRSPEGIALLVAGKLGGLGPGAGCDGPVAKIARDLRVRVEGHDPIVVVDHKAGFEDAARGALTAVDIALVAVDPTTAALRMAGHLAATVAAIRRGVPPATQHLAQPELAALAVRIFRDARVRGVMTVLNRVASQEDEVYLRRALGDGGLAPIAVFGDEPAVAAQWLRGEPLQSHALAKAGQECAREIFTIGPSRG
jgi:CO dehydrogenase nickel-insertion accessory protein CooC1